MTDNHGYETPKRGATEWHESLNRNFRYIDRDVEIRDINAAKSDYRPKSGAKFLATDTEDVYIGDGSQWLRLATSGENPSFDTVLAKTIVDRSSGNGYSVDQLAGGSGSGGVEPAADAIVTLEGGTPTAYRTDGTQIAQDSDAGALLNSALTEAATNGGGTVHIGSGTFVSSSKIEVPSNITVRGSGRGNTMFRATAPGTGWTVASRPARNITIRDLTIDGDLQGGRTGINLVKSIDSLIQNVEVKNAGGTDENPDSTPSLRVTGGTRSHIVNCHVEGSNSVSIEAAIRAEECAIVNCTVAKGRRAGNIGFLHGISIEKSDSCAILGCTVDSTRGGDPFRPALNANNADHAVVANNRVIGGSGGLYNANGPCYDNTYVGNTFEDVSNAVKIKPGNAGMPQGTLLANNVFRGGYLEVMAKDSVVRNNLFNDVYFRIRSPVNGASIVGNHFYGHGGTEDGLGRIEGADNDAPILFANNYVQRGTTTEINDPVFKITADYGLMIGNVFGTYGGSNPKRAPLKFEEAVRWLVSNNYFRGPDSGTMLGIQMCGGRMANNVFEGVDRVQAENGDETLVIENNDHLRSSSSWEIRGGSGEQAYTIGEPRMGTYTGDGTTGRFIETFSKPEHVIVEGSDGTLYDIHAAFGNGFEYTAPSGELSITDGGFRVGGDGGNAHPNSSGESYTFYAR